MDKANWVGVWIDVRTPPVFDRSCAGTEWSKVLGFFSDTEDVEIVHYMKERGDSTGHWSIDCADGDRCNVDRHITHWMPLPEPPKEMQ